MAQLAFRASFSRISSATGVMFLAWRKNSRLCASPCSYTPLRSGFIGTGFVNFATSYMSALYRSEHPCSFNGTSFYPSLGYGCAESLPGVLRWRCYGSAKRSVIVYSAWLRKKRNQRRVESLVEGVDRRSVLVPAKAKDSIRITRLA